MATEQRSKGVKLGLPVQHRKPSREVGCSPPTSITATPQESGTAGKLRFLRRSVRSGSTFHKHFRAARDIEARWTRPTVSSTCLSHVSLLSYGRVVRPGVDGTARD